MTADPGAAAKAMEQQQRAEALKEMAATAVLVRNALIAALPVAPEQYLTLSVPGTVVDTEDIAKGGTFVYDTELNPFTPTQVRQAEAKLVDGMMPLANIMIGQTGKSVSRSYSSALDYLVPKKATVSTENQIRSPGSKAYDDAMKYLTSVDPNTGRNPVEVYMEKQTAWAKAQDAWDLAKIQARTEAEKANPRNNAGAVQAYNDWNQSHYRRYKEATQACWMDWVTNGNKYNVEYNFGLVDVDSIMGRIENSKQSMRNSTIVDADGANEIQEVNLTPKNWARLCKNKADGFYERNGNFSIDELNAEISRLQLFSVSLQVLKDELNKTPPAYPKANPGPKPDLDQVKSELTQAYTGLYEAQGKLNSDIGTELANADAQAVDAARQNLSTKISAWEDAANALVKWNLSQPQGREWLDKLITTVDGQLDQLRAKAGEMTGAKTDLIAAIVSANGSQTTGDAPAGATPGKTSGNNVAAAGYELANPIFGVTAPGSTTTTPPGADPWTKISASFSASDLKSSQDTSTWGMNAGVSVGFGLFSAGGSYSHDESSIDMRSDMAKCDVSITFSALVVNIDRPWLYSELFNDFEIDIGADAKLSPGPENIHDWIKSLDISSLAMYNVFPAYPASFIVASDCEIVFTGETKHIESHFHAVSNSATVRVGWGPFSVSGGFHSSSTHSSFQMQTTATGCKISFAAPQIIAWVSQILPALPRDAAFQPLLQTRIQASSQPNAPGQ